MKYLLSICFLIYFSFEVKSQVVIAGHAIGFTREVEGTVVLIDGELLHGKLILPGSFDKKVNHADLMIKITVSTKTKILPIINIFLPNTLFLVLRFKCFINPLSGV